MLKPTGDARLTDEQLPTLGIFGAVCMQPLQAPPAFGAVVACPDDLKRLSGPADTDASHHLVVVDRVDGGARPAGHAALPSNVFVACMCAFERGSATAVFLFRGAAGIAAG